GLPWLVLAARPSLAERLPRPGAWMEFLERGMAFLLLAASLYLMSLLPEARHFAAAALLLAAGFCAWVFGRFFGPSSGRREKAAGLVLCAAAAVCAFAVMRPAEPAAHAEYSHEALMENLGRRNIILDFTADWCPNCRVLEKTVLTKARIAELERKYGAVLLVVDLTRKDAGRQALLEAMGSRSIPLTALVGAKDPSRPLVLRDMYSPAALEKAAAECFEPFSRP
ncbi:MAG: thioredoxin family protein, partial [Mailhella sp.]|nr:thioredoxin family protein [Mailhella sp.]